jgi:hypothetical protein
MEEEISFSSRCEGNLSGEGCASKLTPSPGRLRHVFLIRITSTSTGYADFAAKAVE